MNQKRNRENLEKMMLVILIGSLAIVLGIIESMIPIRLPILGAKLGLANIMIVIGLYYLDAKDMLTVIILKTFLTTLLMGTFSMFAYGFVGALLSYMGMMLAFKLLGNKMSLLGISILGGILHNVGQIIVAMILIKTKAIAYYMMFLLPLGAITGIAVGIVAKLVMPRLNEFDLFKTHYKLKEV